MIYFGFIFYPKWTKQGTEATISWDVSGYYAYLPATFIYRDLKQAVFLDSVIQKYQPTPDKIQGGIDPKSGNFVFLYTAGQAVVMSPFFFIGHAWALSSDNYPADGYTRPYQVSIGMGMFLIALLGLFVLRKVLLKYFSDGTVALVLVAIVFGTNYLNYGAIDQAMTHNPLFTLYALIMWVAIRFYERPRAVTMFLMGGIAGLAALIRPTEVIILLIPLLWGVSNLTALSTRLQFFVRQWKYPLMAAVSFTLIVGIQAVYWKYVTGSWYYYSYGEFGFDFLNPHLDVYLFSYRCGWLRYTPMMMLAYIGLIPLLKRRLHLYALLPLILLNLYIVTAWEVWDYGGTAGRAMVQSYPVLAFPMAALIEWVHRRSVVKWFFYPVFALCIYMNFWWVINAHCDRVQVIDLTRQYYRAVAGRWHTDDYDKKLLDNIHSYRGEPVAPKLVYFNNFEADTSLNVIAIEDNHVLRINDALDYTEEYFIAKPVHPASWIRARALFSCVAKEWTVWRQAQFILRFYNQGEVVQTNVIRVYRFLNDHEKKVIFLDARVPQQWDSMGVQFWNAGGTKELLIDDLEVVMFDGAQ